jgi:ribose 5-phosphate isomerase A
MPDHEREKQLAAAHAVSLVKDGMKVGLGTGSTAAIAVKLLGERVRGGLDVVAIPTSERTKALAQIEKIPMTDFTKVTALDITIDGCDEADRELRLVKGGGGALLREKVVASVSERVVIIADSTKLVDRLGKYPLPVEVVRFAWPVVASRLRGLGAEPTLRLAPDGTPFLTDERHFILDAAFGQILDPERLSRYLLSTPGVVDHGLFLDLAHDLVIGRGDKVEVI